MLSLSHSSPEKLAPPSVYLLADNLDAVLSAGEDMVAIGRSWALSGIELAADALPRIRADQRSTIEKLRTFELSMIARVHAARRGAETLAQDDARFRLMAELFVAGTTAFVDAVAECYDATEIDFDTGDTVLTYLIERGLVPHDATSTDGILSLNVTDEFLVAKRIQLGVLLELVARFLDMLEAYYELYADVEDSAEAIAKPQASAA